MEKITMFNAILPMIPANYRRPLLFYIHFEEMMNIMASLKKCLNTPIPDCNDTMSKDPKELINVLKQNMSKQDSDMLDMFYNMQNMSSMFSAMNNAGAGDNKTDNNNFSEDIDNLFKDFLNETQK